MFNKVHPSDMSGSNEISESPVGFKQGMVYGVASPSGTNTITGEHDRGGS